MFKDFNILINLQKISTLKNFFLGEIKQFFKKNKNFYAISFERKVLKNFYFSRNFITELIKKKQYVLFYKIK